MGYPSGVCAEALKQANNKLEEATDMLLNHADILMVTIQSKKKQKTTTFSNDDQQVTPANETAQLAQLIALGAEPEIAHALLTIHGNQVERAAEEFVQRMSQFATASSSDVDIINLIERARQIIDRQGRIHP
jgi:hypothetical protein